MNNLGEQTRYYAVLKNIWDIQKVREPRDVLDIAAGYENNSGPSQTYLRIDETMNRLKTDCVITSYSIHYTKLYGNSIFYCNVYRMLNY